MKYLYSHRTRSADGQSVHIGALTQALRNRGAEIIMAGPKEAGAKAGGGTQLHAGGGAGLKQRLPAPLYECAEYGYSFPAYWRLAQLAKQHRPDILYERYNLFFHAGVWLKRRTGLPMILEVNAPLVDERSAHGDLALKAFARHSEAAIWRAADKVLPVTNVLADIVRAAGVPEARIEVIQNGVDDDFLTQRDPGPVRDRYGLTGKLVLGFTGFVRDWHRVDRAIQFLATHPRNDMHLLIVGDGPARAGLELLARALGLRARVHFTGVVQRDAMAEHVAAFDIALQPAVVDYASPLKLFEYMAQAKPVIAPDAANIREVLSDGDDGLLFGDDGFERVLSALADNANLRARLGTAGRATLRQRDYTWAGNAQKVERISATLLGNKTP